MCIMHEKQIMMDGFHSMNDMWKKKMNFNQVEDEMPFK
jgi:hypothetical protein